MTRIVGLGAGGHARSVLDALLADPAVEVVGLLDPDRSLHAQTVCGVPVLGDDAMLPSLLADGVGHFVLGLAGAGVQTARSSLFARACETGLRPWTLIHPRAHVSPFAEIGAGATVLAQAVVNAGARLAENVLVNTSAVVEHDCEIEAHAHLATGAKLAGSVRLGAESMVGVGAAVRQGIAIGRCAVVGGGAMVVSDVEDGQTVAGVPARVLRG
jgi:UDP-perosamine 4-acetyltransferase